PLILAFVSHPPHSSASSSLSLHDALPISGVVHPRLAVSALHVQLTLRQRDGNLQGLLPHTEGPPDGRRCDDQGGVQTSRAQIPSDRKSTRLNSSHQIISYAVFCLKKKNN